MGKIKSTLDLVMERTRNLTLSDDEKEQLAIEDGKKAFNGLLQKYQDQLLKISELGKELSRLKKKYPALTDKVLRSALLEKIDLDTVDGPLTELLSLLFDLQQEKLQQVSRDFKEQRTSQVNVQIQKLTAVFKEQYGISGSAMTPNPDAHPQWQVELEALRKNFNEQLDREKAALS